jgi:sugar phosphate isomerase/epimerase
MIRSPLGLRLDPSRPIREQIREAARLGAKGVVIDAIGELGPERLSETGRRELRYLLRSLDLGLIALHLPTRRPFDTNDQIEDRLRRAEGAFAMAFELGSALVLARVGDVPPDAESPARQTFVTALRALGRRADHRGVRLAIETGPDSGEVMRPFLDGLDELGLAASIDPAALIQNGNDPLVTTRSLGPWVAHAYAGNASSTVVSGIARRSGRPSGGLDWEEYLGSLEEIDYRGYLTVWPDPTGDPAADFEAVVARASGH